MFANTKNAVGNINAAVANLKKANTAANNGQTLKANNNVNAATKNIGAANNQLNNASKQAKRLGLNNVSRNLKRAANTVKEAKLIEALKHTANAVNQLKTTNSQRILNAV